MEQAYTIGKIAQIIKGKRVGSENRKITVLSIDSRSLYQPDETLFFALPGERHDGHSFVPDLYKKGVRCFVICKPDIQPMDFPEATFVVVNDSLQALQQLTRKHREQFTYPVIGITGSNGKTIVKEWLYHILQDSYRIVRSPRSYNSQVGVPLSVWNMNADTNLAIFEAGISQPNEMEKLAHIIKPTLGVITHIGDAHRENFKGQLHLINEKIKLFETCQELVYCSDLTYLHNTLLGAYRAKRKLYSWSRKKRAFVTIIEERIEGNQTHITCSCSNHIYKFVIPFTDKASVNNVISCYTTGMAMGLDSDAMAQKIMSLEHIAMRLEMKEAYGNSIIINDYYNSDLGSLEIALDFINRQQTDKQKTLILSDIYQSGYSNRKLYKSVAHLLDKKKIHRLIGVGQNISSQKDLFDMDASFYPSTNSFLKELDRKKFQNAVILIKGARDFRFERISEALQFKAHRTVLEVDLTAMVHNLNYFRSLLQPQTKLMVMVKAFSYGSGSLEIANLLQYHRVDYLAVAIADEGVELRNAGISIPIIVMNPELHSFETMIEYRLEPEIYDQNILNEFQKALHRNLVKKYPIHIKLDTGMHRMGFMQHDIDPLVEQIRNNDCFYIASVFSHLAGADEEMHDEFTREQIELFKQWSHKICSQFSYPIHRHVLNSAGIERFPEAQFEMVRLGLGLYGVSPVHQEKLMNVSSLKTTISQIKTIPAQNTVGYGRKGVMQKDTRIGIIPIGYADGFNRKLSNGVGKVLVNGTFCPIVGNICMDMSMIDLSNTQAKQGDTVLIFGDEYPVSQLAQQLNTIPYEILTTISRRVKRIYLQE